MISIIAAIGKNNELGKNNKLIWHLKNDMKYFRETTLNHPIIMGYNTYLSIGRPLPNRKNIVLTRKDIKIDGSIVYHSIEDLLAKEDINSDEYFVIGGASIYNSFINLANKMYLTMIDAEFPNADAYFPTFNDSEWIVMKTEEKNEEIINYKFVVYERNI